ncbi:MAG: cytochrome P450 [Myxococcota bacterium]|nr:cytochrome P450 [Myxococcota bacterium]
MTDVYYDPYDYDIDADPHSVWKRMRDDAPVYRNEKFDFYALSRFHDVMTASLDAKTFSSAYGTVLELMTDEPGDTPMMIFLDAPKHTQLRKLVSRAFSPRRISQLETNIRKVAAGYLDPLVGRSEFDYLQDFGAKLPVMVISALLGVPEEDREQIRVWTDSLLHRDEGETNADRAHADVSANLWGYFGRYVESRRSNPQDDMISDLMSAEIDLPDGSKRRLENAELLAFIGLLSGAGNETVARFLGWTCTLLDRHPDQRAALVAEPSLIPNAVEEILRYEAPSPVQGRRTTCEIELHGSVIPKGGKVLLLTGSAGRDEREYPEADRFDVTRDIDRHVALGYGTHFCLGASLARMEARIAIEETLIRFPEWEVRWDETERVHTSTVRGYHRVPVRV